VPTRNGYNGRSLETFLYEQGMSMTIQEVLNRGVFAVLGGMAGGVAGVALLGTVCWAVGYEGAGAWIFLAGAAVAGTAGMAFGAVAGAVELRGRAKAIVLGTLAGCVLGLLAVVLSPNLPEFLRVEVSHGAVDRLVGLAAGGVLGGLAGFVVGTIRQRDGGLRP
jgi:hypothetical protein